MALLISQVRFETILYIVLKFEDRAWFYGGQASAKFGGKLEYEEEEEKERKKEYSIRSNSRVSAFLKCRQKNQNCTITQHT